MGKKVLLAMSGGIDSSAAAVILLNEGFDVTGYTFRISGVSSDAVDRAATICRKLGITHIYDDITSVFNKSVIQYFKKEYENGRTPNPCIKCNRDIKFGIIYDYAIKRNFDYVATGHYASIINTDDRCFLAEAVDKTRDQTYFLYVLKEKQLSRILFPLNGVPKSHARKICSDAGILPADSKESREICFIPDNYRDFLADELGVYSKKGNFILKDGSIIGRHKGIISYTIGQRKGLGIHLGKPGYILSINSQNGDIVIGDEYDLYVREIIIKDINLINASIPNSDSLYVKIRYGARPVKIKSIDYRNGNIKIKTNEILRAPTPGQSAVIYNDKVVVGGGIII